MTRRALLIVEDDTDLREYFHVALRNAGHKVSVAADGLEALRRIDAGFLPDVIILDLGLPVLNGHDVLAELAAHSQTRSIRVIIVTGSPVRPSHPSVHCTLLKPVTAEHLLATVEECLAQ
jgi:two-component system KDP operon response regulator KdpE